MAEYRFGATIQVLWTYHKNGKDKEETAAELISNGHFEYFQVCVAAINYWFSFFNENPTRFSNELVANFVTREESLAFLSVLLKDNPFWSTTQFMDALKVSRGTIYNYLGRLNMYYSRQGWMQRQQENT